MAGKTIGLCDGLTHCRGKSIDSNAKGCGECRLTVKICGNSGFNFKTEPDGKGRRSNRGDCFIPIFHTGELTANSNNSTFPLVQRELLNRTLADAAIKIVVHIFSFPVSLFRHVSVPTSNIILSFCKKSSPFFNFFLFFLFFCSNRQNPLEFRSNHQYGEPSRIKSLALSFVMIFEGIMISFSDALQSFKKSNAARIPAQIISGG